MVVSSGVDQVLERAVNAGAVAGVVAAAADSGGVIYEGAFGKRAADGTAPMTVDTVVWIASMTKAVTSVAALQLVDQGRLSLDEPLSNRIPSSDRSRYSTALMRAALHDCAVHDGRSHSVIS